MTIRSKNHAILFSDSIHNKSIIINRETCILEMEQIITLTHKTEHKTDETSSDEVGTSMVIDDERSEEDE